MSEPEPYGDGAPWQAAPQQAPPQPERPRYLLAASLLGLTFLTATTLGAFWGLPSSAQVVREEPLPLLGPGAVLEVWQDPLMIRLGLQFSLPLLAILLAHELGHYLACRRYGVTATLPYFVPAPFAFGTLGAFIKIKSPLRNKRELFDVGIAGPIAGFVVLLPFLWLGFVRSRPVNVEEILALAGDQPVPTLGFSLGMSWVGDLVYGPLPESSGLELHPFALAAWVGVLATALNLLPLGQLDGGHILYALAGRRQRWLAVPLWLLLVLAGLIWPGWWLWALLVLVMGLRHPPVWDEQEPLGRVRTLLALVALAIFVFCFMPVPVGFI